MEVIVQFCNRFYSLFIILFILFSSTLPAFEAHINCGSPDYFTHPDMPDIIWQPDIEYTEGGYGYIGGEPFTGDWVTGGTANSIIYINGRKDLAEYRFDLPDGEYIVKLFFAEKIIHGAGLRVMDVSIEDEPVLSDFDICSFRGKDYAIIRIFMVNVSDGILNIEFSATTGRTTISGISVIPAAYNTESPSVPVSLNAWSSYYSVLLSWRENFTDPDWAGFFVYRSTDGTTWDRIIDEPVTTIGYADNDVDHGTLYSYRITSVDIYGNESDFSNTTSSVTPLVKGETDLPVYEIFLSDSALLFLLSDPFRDEYVPGRLCF
jgi:hypothetical protein